MHNRTFRISDLGKEGKVALMGDKGTYDAATSSVDARNEAGTIKDVKIEGDSCGTVINLDNISQGMKGYVNFGFTNTRGAGGDPINLNLGVLADPLTFVGSGGVAAALVDLATDNADLDDDLGVGAPKWSAFVRRVVQGKNLIITRLKVITADDTQRAESLDIIAADLNTNRCNVVGRNPLSWTTNVGYTQGIIAGADTTHGLTYAILADIGRVDVEFEFAAIEVATFTDVSGDCQ